MAFIMRTTKPEAGNKYYITKGNGGWSDAIKGNSANRDKDCDVLPNCFDGDTKFITSEGIKTLKECENKNIKVLTEDGMFRDATVKNFGEQKLYKITFNNGSSYLVTANHRWIVDKLSSWNGKKYQKRVEKTTLELKSTDYVPYVMAQHTNKIDPNGVRHGFIFGDGSLYCEKRHAKANLCGLKKEYMYEWFENSSHINHQKDGTICAYPYTSEYKALPSLSNEQSYLRGFICGYLAADGCVADDGSIRLSCCNNDTLEYVKDICAIIGIRTSKIKVEYRKGYGEVETPLYHIYFHRETVDEDMLLNPIHKERFISIESREIKYTRLKSIEETDIVTEVYCVQEPETHTMVLADNVLTGQCVGYAYGRFNEIGGYGYCKYLTPVNAENFIQYKNPELKVGQTPKVGACMVWQKGDTLTGSDGAGHVAIVEKVISDTEVYTSESGWNSQKVFYNKTRVKGAGDWGMGSSYKFLGFIYNPATENLDTQVTPPAKPSNNSASTTIKAGDVVSIAKGAVYYTGKAIPAWVIAKKWIVKETPSGDRVVIDKSQDGTNAINSPVAAKYLTVVGSSTSSEWTPKVGDIVNYTGSVHYVSANAANAKSCKGGKAKITSIYRLGKSKHPYHLVRESGSGATVYGWVDAGTFTKA